MNKLVEGYSSMSNWTNYFCSDSQLSKEGKFDKRKMKDQEAAESYRGTDGLSVMRINVQIQLEKKILKSWK